MEDDEDDDDHDTDDDDEEEGGAGGESGTPAAAYKHGVMCLESVGSFGNGVQLNAAVRAAHVAPNAGL